MDKFGNSFGAAFVATLLTALAGLIVWGGYSLVLWGIACGWGLWMLIALAVFSFFFVIFWHTESVGVEKK